MVKDSKGINPKDGIVPERSRDDLILMGVEILNGLDLYDKSHYSEKLMDEMPMYKIFDVSSQMISEVGDIRYMYFTWVKEVEDFVTFRGIKKQWLIEAGLIDAVINTGVVALGVDAKAPFLNGLLRDIKNETQRKIGWLKSLPIITHGEAESVFAAYDQRSACLTFAGKEIQISKSNDSDAARLMATLAKDIRKSWHKDEIYDDWSYDMDEQKNLPKQKIYQAALTIQTIIAQKTQTNDFLIFSTKEVRVNPKYLGK